MSVIYYKRFMLLAYGDNIGLYERRSFVSWVNEVETIYLQNLKSLSKLIETLQNLGANRP